MDKVSNTKLETGRRLRQELMGESAPERSDPRYSNPEMELFTDISREFVFGTIWAREGLDRKTRSLICVALDVATHAWPELKIHIAMALRCGLSEAELTEALIHMIPYVGVPAVREAMLIASAQFHPSDQESE